MGDFDILKLEVQKFINENWQRPLAPLILKGSRFPEVTIQEIAQQLEGKRKTKKKLPLWFSSEKIIYPPAINIEQSSSETTAAYKASWVTGETLVDLTGGFGIDDFYFAKKMNQVIHCERNKQLSQIAVHNFKQLAQKQNIKFHLGDGLEFLKSQSEKCDWIYVDPSRRTNTGNKVFRLEDCEPTILENLGLLLQKSQQILLKTSPLLDLSLGIKQLQHVAEIHIVAVNNEVKELLWILGKAKSHLHIPVKTINFGKHKTEKFNGIFPEETKEKNEISHKKPAKFLYEPNAAIMKSGLFGTLSDHFKVEKIAPHSHLFTSEEKIAFPGRRFQILGTYPFNKKKIKGLEFKKANISIRNFPISVKSLRKKFNIKEGGEDYFFFTTDNNGNKMIIHGQKIPK